MNFYVQAGGFLLIIWVAKQLNLYVITLWGLMYATIHNINYAIRPPATHMCHHIDKTTNYGIDIWDIIFNSKYGDDYSVDKIENINHYAINTAIITVCILLVMNVKVSINVGF
jgi:sterol desaturase/sphingolipid hydroxylase (fatty acid hydroxylase superfamily)